MIVNNIPSHITKVMLFFGIAILVTSPAFALGAGARNMLLIGAMAISPLLLVQYPIFNKRVDWPLMLFLLCTISFPNIRSFNHAMEYGFVFWNVWCLFYGNDSIIPFFGCQVK